MAFYTRDALADEIEKKGWSIGEFTYGRPVVRDWNSGTKLTIGKYGSISVGVEIFLSGNHRTDWVTTYPFSALRPAFRHIKGHPATKGEVIIGHDVWLGAGCRILSGVRIGHGACIGTNAVVTKDVPAYAIVGGNPATIIKKRFTDRQIEELLEIAWWNWPAEDVEANVPLLLSGDIDKFIREHRRVSTMRGDGSEKPSELSKAAE
ncbi:CatB-related O-acetyltransferase [Jiella avicenniae]|uniref:CatB-related O-acetyltransferase n=1 Tax=Jiella avicenniae TaxID=2907202 RepID=A0A9X1TDV2_9HYPH|nr:CatB-related O-acetyltransferase [Jiella avicenniae]MCE7030568.1 CatB-related O-acetyltransferase [Jiella avicenniae]